MKTENTYIEHLIEKFFEGKTSNGEEKELWLYFSSENIPDHLKRHREFFLYYGNGFMIELGEIKRLSMKEDTQKKRRTKIMTTIAVSTVAAILIFAIVSPFAIPFGKRFDPYEGSYMVVNGERIYDIDLIKQQEKEIREMTATRQKEYQEIYTQSESRKNELRNIMMVNK